MIVPKICESLCKDYRRRDERANGEDMAKTDEGSMRICLSISLACEGVESCEGGQKAVKEQHEGDYSPSLLKRYVRSASGKDAPKAADIRCSRQE